jgi:hypothetical protein
MINDLLNVINDTHASYDQRLKATIGLGRPDIAGSLRADLENPGTMDLTQVDESINSLTRTMWNMDEGQELMRSEAAHSLGQIGGLEPAKKLLKRLHSLWVDRLDESETLSVRAELFVALVKTLDRATLPKLRQSMKEFEWLRDISGELLNNLQQSEDLEYIYPTALSLSRLALRIQHEWPDDALPGQILRGLLTASEPRPTLAAVGALLDIQSDLEEIQEKSLGRLFERLEALRGRPYPPDEKSHLLETARDYRSMQHNTQVASDHFWGTMD